MKAASIPAAMLRSHQRVQALADVCHRYGAIVKTLTGAIEAVLDDVDGDVREVLDSALGDVAAQIAATGGALEFAVKDLPEAGAA